MEGDIIIIVSTGVLISTIAGAVFLLIKNGDDNWLDLDRPDFLKSDDEEITLQSDTDDESDDEPVVDMREESDDEDVEIEEEQEPQNMTEMVEMLDQQIEELQNQLDQTVGDLEGADEDIRADVNEIQDDIDMVQDHLSRIDDRTNELAKMYDAFARGENPLNPEAGNSSIPVKDDDAFDVDTEMQNVKEGNEHDNENIARKDEETVTESEEHMDDESNKDDVQDDEETTVQDDTNNESNKDDVGDTQDMHEKPVGYTSVPEDVVDSKYSDLDDNYPLQKIPEGENSRLAIAFAVSITNKFDMQTCLDTLRLYRSQGYITKGVRDDFADLIQNYGSDEKGHKEEAEISAKDHERYLTYIALMCSER